MWLQKMVSQVFCFVSSSKRIGEIHVKFFLFSIPIGGSVSRSSSVLVDIKAPGDSRPQFLQKTYQGEVEEEQEAGAEIVKVTFLEFILQIQANCCN